MTTYLPFVPSNVSAPTYSVTLDGNQYVLVVTWNVAAQRYYINLYDVNGTLICCVPLIETAIGRPVLSMYWDINERVIIGTFGNALWRPLGQIIQYTFNGFTPDVLNDKFDCLRTGYGMFQYPMATNPGVISVLGFGSRTMNLVAGYFNTSTLVYREGKFEVNP